MEQKTIVLIGKTGEGKSSSGNTILGKEEFITRASAISVTVKSERKQGFVHGRKITVIDTPGFFDTDRDEKEIKSEIVNSLIECAPGVHAFCFVLKVGRYTKQENEVVQQFLNTMRGEQVLKHTAILFTHGEQLEGQTIEEFVKDNSKLQELVDKCGGRCHVFDNTYWNDCDSGYKSNKVQVKNLLDAIDKMVKENGFFTNELLQKIEEDVQEEVKKNRDNVPPEEKREKAKKIVRNKYMVQFAGLATGVLIGALLGVGVAVAAALILLKQCCPIKELVKGKIAEITEEAEVAKGAVVASGTGAAAAGAGVKGFIGVSAFTGAIVGGATGWKAAEEADSVYDAMTKAAKLNCENAKAMVEKIQELCAFFPTKIE